MSAARPAAPRNLRDVNRLTVHELQLHTIVLELGVFARAVIGVPPEMPGVVGVHVIEEAVAVQVVETRVPPVVADAHHVGSDVPAGQHVDGFVEHAGAAAAGIQPDSGRNHRVE